MEKRFAWVCWAPVVFALALGGTTALAQGSFGLLHSFTGATNDGAIPEGTPLLISSNLYGVTYFGGSSALGTVYQVSTNGTGFNVVYSFTGGANGANPFGSLVFDGSTLYGMTFNGGVDDGGIVFGVGTNRTGFSVLHTFLGGANDGLYPFGSPTLISSNLYGMTANGGTNDEGVIFKISTNGTPFSVVHSFAGKPNDGSFPNEGVILQGTTLYGTTYYGGSNDFGTVFAMDTAAVSNAFKILHQFGGTNDGANPSGPLTLLGSSLFGITTAGGSTNLGVIFKVDTSGANFAVLHHFLGGTNDGALPQFGPLAASNSVLYGTAESGGASARGVLFQIGTDGTGFTILHSFSTNANDGAFPVFGPILSGSLLYGTTVNGGSTNLGVVYGGPVTPVLQGVCGSVPAILSNGTPFMTIVAGVQYDFTASGTACNDCKGECVDPDGMPFGLGNTETNTPCPTLHVLSLVGEVNGTCIQLGTSGAFIAPSTGTLNLLMNDNIHEFTNNCGAWSVCITPVQEMCTNVPAGPETAASGVVIGTVVGGQTYEYQASGCVQRAFEPQFADPDGNEYINTCSPENFEKFEPAPGNATCPGLRLFSLVGKVAGGSCIEMGKLGFFQPTVSGPLTLYFNDNNYSDNTGFFSVCITPVSQTCTSTLTQVSAIQIQATNVLITVPSVPCMMYQLQYSAEMVPTNWVNIAGALQAGTGSPVTLTDVNGAVLMHRFYRVDEYP